MITVSTWNVYHGTPVGVLRPLFRSQIERGVSLNFSQEAGGRDISLMFETEDWLTYLADNKENRNEQTRISWDPEVWVAVDLWTERLSPTPFFAKGSSIPRFTDMACGIFSDRKGRTILAGSYHLAPHVQNSNPPPNRKRQSVEAFNTMARMAKNAKTHAVVFGGDDNIDERKGFLWSVRPVLRQVKAPKPTHGKRKIDDFRLLRGGALWVGDGWTMNGGGDHDIHGRKLGWKNDG